MFSPKKILVPTDFSEFSDNALQHAVDIARQFKSRIYLLHVVGIVRICSADYCLDNEMVNYIEKNSFEYSKEMMKKQIKKTSKTEDIKFFTDVRKGVPYEEILEEQKAKKADLIVIASHGRTGLLGHFIGSVAEKVSRSAKCPVLLVRK